MTSSLRKFFNDIHLWLGLGSGIVLFVVCLTGTILTFEHEIIQMADHHKYVVVQHQGSLPLPVDQLIKAVEGKTRSKVISIEIPAENNRVYQLGVKGKKGADLKTSSPLGPSAEGPRGKTLLVNPYTGDILGTTESTASRFFQTTMQLHRWLLVRGAGRVVVGVATLVFVLLVVSGLILWLPRKKRAWKQGFKVKTSGNWKRINHDLHNTLGFYSFILLLVMGLTGLCWSFEWYRNGMSALLGDKVFKQKMEKPLLSDLAHLGAERQSVAALMRASDVLLPYKGTYRLRFPPDSTGSFVVSKTSQGFLKSSGADKIQYDQYTGKVLKLERFEDRPINEKIASSIRSIHTGDIYGGFSKVLYFLSCLIATSLPVSGTIIWLNKLKKKKRKAQILSPSAAEYYDI